MGQEYSGRSYGQTVTCSACGSRVDAGLTAAHDAWHAKMERAAVMADRGVQAR